MSTSYGRRVFLCATVALTAIALFTTSTSAAGPGHSTVFGAPSSNNIDPAQRKRPGLRTSWVKLNTASEPSDRAAMAAAYDPVSRTVVLFGGFTTLDYPSDTWSFDGTTWTQITGTVSPPGRAGATLMFDLPTQKLILFGGYDGSQWLNDTWIFDGATGTWEAGTPATVPPPGTGPSGFTDPSNGRATFFGGYDGHFYQLDTWQWDGSDWVQLAPVNSPGARSAAACGVDPSRSIAVLFGGLASINPNNTWTWDGSTWNGQLPNVQPPLRYNSAAAFDAVFSAVLMFGGGAGGPELNDLWEWTGSDWVEISTGRTPSGRESFAFVYDEDLNEIVLFGGQAGDKLLNDTWVLTHR